MKKLLSAATAGGRRCPGQLMLSFLILFSCSGDCFDAVFLLRSVSAQQQQPFSLPNRPLKSYSFSSFSNSFRNSNLTVLQDANINQGALQITPDTLNLASSYLSNKTGRVFFSDPFTLWRHNSSSAGRGTDGFSVVASFSVSFSVNIFRPNNTIPGDGLVFLISSSPDPPPPDSHGGFLGLTNASTDASPDNHFLAIELDTFKQSYDPDDDHVGIDVNGVRSLATTSLRPLGIEIAPVIPANYTVWVDYDGDSRHMWVYMARMGGLKPDVPVLNASVDVTAVLSSPKAYLGFSASTGTNAYELHCVLGWNITVEDLEDDDGQKPSLPGWKVGVIVAAALAAAAVSAFLCIMTAICWRRKRGRQLENKSSVVSGKMIKHLPGTPKEFKYKAVKKATRNFDQKQRLGEGGYGVVYRGKLEGAGENGESMEVAVKDFSRASTEGQRDFLDELTVINRLRHRNLVRLVGWCHDNGRLLLIYDYMPNGSLDQHLFSRSNLKSSASVVDSTASATTWPILDWPRRYNIVCDIARAIHYLHYEYDHLVVHRDIKPSNIMLDSSFNARLGDFGLARALDSDKTSYAERSAAGVAGTFGYIAPECFHTGKATRESDIFGFGAVVLAIVVGRRIRCDDAGNNLLVDWVWNLHGQDRILEAVDPKLAGDYDQEDARRLLLLGLACSNPQVGQRPNSPAIMQILLRTASPPLLPLSMPRFVWPPPPPSGSLTTDAAAGTMTTATEMSASYHPSSMCTTTSTQSLLQEGHLLPPAETYN